MKNALVTGVSGQIGKALLASDAAGHRSFSVLNVNKTRAMLDEEKTLG